MKALKGQGLDPLGHGERRHLAQPCGAGQLDLGIHKAVIGFVEARRHFKLDLWDDFAVDAGYGCVVFLDDVQDDAVIGRILVVVVTLPVAGAHVDLDVAHPQVTVNLDLGVEEVGPRVGIEQAGVDDADAAAIVGHHVLAEPQLVLPDVLQQSFHVF